jgi:hypothetical protein
MSPESTAGPRGEGAPMDVIPRVGVGPTPANGASTAVCTGCGAPLAVDQRYCLSCGRPCSPVRLAFLDVLQTERQPAGVGEANFFTGGPSAGYASAPEPAGLLASLRRYSGLFGLLTVLLASLLIGLLVGHWLTGGNGSATGKQVFEVKGLSSPVAAAAPLAPTSTASSNSPGSATGHTPSTSSSSSQSHNPPKSEKAEEAEDAKEVKTTKALPAPHKTSAATSQKLSHTTGKQHAKEVAALGDEPIETGH